jgi:vesicle transport protein SEC22
MNSPSKQIIDSGTVHVNYAIFDQLIVVFAVTEKAYPKNLAFKYIQDVYTAFAEDLRHQYGNYQQAVATAGRPYQYLAFDRAMQRISKEYADVQSKTNQARLNDELADVHNIMRKNISELLDRGEKLGELSQVSTRLRDESKRFKWGAKKLNIMDVWAKAAPVAGVLLFVVGIVYWRFFS